MANFREVRIIKEKLIGDKVWQIISYYEDELRKFDVVYYYKSDADIMAKELISSKKIVKTFKDNKKADEFLEKLTS